MIVLICAWLCSILPCPMVCLAAQCSPVRPSSLMSNSAVKASRFTSLSTPSMASLEEICLGYRSNRSLCLYSNSESLINLNTRWDSSWDASNSAAIIVQRTTRTETVVEANRPRNRTSSANRTSSKIVVLHCPCVARIAYFVSSTYIHPSSISANIPNL